MTVGGNQKPALGGMPTGRRPPANYVCAKCKAAADHYLNECPENTCFRCGQKGHIATYCEQGRTGGGAGEKRAAPAGGREDLNDSRAQLQRMGSEDARSGMGMGGGGMRME